MKLLVWLAALLLTAAFATTAAPVGPPALSAGGKSQHVVALPPAVLSRIDAVDVQFDSRCLVAGGAVWCGYGSGWVRIAGSLTGHTATSVSISYQRACAVADHQAHCWDVGSDSSTRVAGALKGKSVDRISVGDDVVCAAASKRAYCWGLNSWGQLGNGTTRDATNPKAVSTKGVLKGRTVTDVAVGSGHACAIANHRAFCWGSNATGQLGVRVRTRVGRDGESVAGSSRPVAVSTAGRMKGLRVTQISANWAQTCAVALRRAFCWGEGHLGNGTKKGSTVPVETGRYGSLKGKKVDQVSAGMPSCALAAGKVHCWDRGFGTRPRLLSAPAALRGRSITGVGTGDNSGVVVAYR